MHGKISKGAEINIHVNKLFLSSSKGILLEQVVIPLYHVVHNDIVSL